MLFKSLFWASYLALPLLLVGLAVFLKQWRLTQRGAMLVGALGAFIAASVFAYARFIEPRILLVKHSDIVLQRAAAQGHGPTLKLALFSDTHFGIFTHTMPMRRIVDRINKEAPDAVMIAGDFLYYLPPDEIPGALAALADLHAPTFAVLGNHDVGFPGPIYTEELYAALSALDVSLVENRAQVVTLAGHEVIVAGTSDLWEQRQDFGFSADLPSLPLFLLTHNPDMAFNVPAGLDYDLMLAGHTHGGQVRIPVLIHKVIPTEHPFDKELHTVQIGPNKRLIFVTTGTGMVGVPFRFNMPPRIDILTIMLPS